MQARRKHGFQGGIHPTDGRDKLLTKNHPIIEYQPEVVKISMKQSPFGRNKQVVGINEWVEEGKLIGVPESAMAVNIHSSVSGIVKKIEYPAGKDDGGICVIEADKVTAAQSGTIPDYENLYNRWNAGALDAFTKEHIISVMQEAGICGMGGAGFPTYLKYKTQKPIHTVLVNGAECEPYLTCDDRLMREEPFAVLCGMILLCRAAGADETVLCIEENKQEAIALLQKLADTGNKRIRVQGVPARYPQGGEKQLIQAVTGREVPMGGLTADVGVLVSNVATAKACADAVIGKHPLTHRIVTVSGMVEKPCNYRVPIGTPVEELLELSGYIPSEETIVILGGPMTGKRMEAGLYREGQFPGVTKTTSAVLVLPAAEYTESPCIRCGACGQVCPAGLVPYQIEYAYLENNTEWCAKLYAPACIGCGCCSYVCPARRPLARRVQEAVGFIKQRKTRERK